jgi:ketosteroid isomerase-like protein
MFDTLHSTRAYSDVQVMCAALDHGDVETFMSYFADDCRFTFANQPVVAGRADVSAAVAGAAGALPGMRHEIVEVVEQGDTLIAELSISIDSAHQGRVTLPCVSVMRRDGGKIVDYRIHMDLTPVFDVASILEIQRATVLEHVTAEAQQRRQDVYATFLDGDQCWFDLMPLGVTFDGRDNVVNFYEGLLSAFDLTMYITKEIHELGTSVIEITLEGPHVGEFMGIAATGRHMAFEASAFFEFDTERPGVMRCERVYFDIEAVSRQLRGEVDEAPVVGLKERSGAQPIH